MSDESQSYWQVGMHIECNVWGRGFVLCEITALGEDTFAIKVLESSIKGEIFRSEARYHLDDAHHGRPSHYRLALPRNTPTTQFGDDT